MGKVCYRCKKEKKSSEFHKSSRESDGLQNYCKVCKRFYTSSHKNMIGNVCAEKGCNAIILPHSTYCVCHAKDGERHPMYGVHRLGIHAPRYGHIFSEATKLKMSESHSGFNNHFYGKKHTEEAKEQNRLAHTGSNSPSWKGGITPLREKLRITSEYKKWRESIFKRDGYACKDCGKTGIVLNAHHKKFFAELRDSAIKTFPELDSFDACLLYDPLWETSNGITLCEKCHIKEHKLIRIGEGKYVF